MSFLLDMAKQAAESVLKPFLPAANNAVQSALAQTRAYTSVVATKAQSVPQVQQAQIAASTVTKSQLATGAAVAATVVGAVGVAALVRKRKAAKKIARKPARKVTKKRKAAKKGKPTRKGIQKPARKAAKKRKQEPHKGSEKKHSRIKGEKVHFTKKGQPYIIEMRTIKGKARRMSRFIKKEGVKKHGK